MIHIDDAIIIKGNFGTDTIVETLCGDKFTNIVFSWSNAPLHMIHHSTHVDHKKHSKIENFIAYMDIAMDAYLEGDKHYDYLIIYIPEEEEETIEKTLADWMENTDFDNLVGQVVIVCQ